MQYRAEEFLRVTYVGWQGWLVASASANILIDPLLGESIGRGARSTQQTFVMWPPRVFDASVCPRLDAVVLSHEHEDHFNIPSLARIDRRVPVILSSRSSIAAYTVLVEMGFDVKQLTPGESLSIKDVTLRFFSPDHRVADLSDEWDTVGYLLSAKGGAGSFFSNVDVPLTPAMNDALAELEGPTLTFIDMSLALRSRAAMSGPQTAAGLHKSPDSAAFAFEDATEKLNAGQSLSPLPGQTVVLDRTGVQDTREAAAFLRTPPSALWPEQPRYWRAPTSPLLPVVDAASWSDDALAELASGLAQLASFMYGRAVFKHLYSLDQTTLQGHVASFVWVLYTTHQARALVFEYRPDACAFMPLDAAAASTRRYAGTITSWATDLLGLFRAEFEPRCIVQGYQEDWIPGCGVSFLRTTLWPYFHPLRHPASCLKQYLEQLAAHRDCDVWFHANQR